MQMHTTTIAMKSIVRQSDEFGLEMERYNSIDYSIFQAQNSNTMRRQPNLQNLGQVYRQFSRQRYNKYRSQFPKLKEAEIVTRIIKEWESMSQGQKQFLGQEYIRKKYITEKAEDQSNSNPSSIHKTPQKTDKFHAYLLSTEKTKNNLSTVKMETKVQKWMNDDEDSVHDCQKMSKQDNSERSSYSLEFINSSDKQNLFNNGPKRLEYVSFYKFHYKKLSRDHQKWSAAKITKIIRLLWQKKRNIGNVAKLANSKSKVSNFKRIRKVSGWVFFKQEKAKEGLKPKDLKLQWNQQPLEKKKSYALQGKGEYPCSGSLYKTGTIRFGQIEQLSNLKFIHHKIES